MSGEEDIAEVVAPNAGGLAESMRDFGYTLPTALADLIDNSLTAGAENIDVVIEARGAESHIAIIDDGAGMNLPTLVEAMRMGTAGPQIHREPEDLGRFGLGLKTASISQGRCLTVASKTASTSKVEVRRWDINHIVASGLWQLLSKPTQTAQAYIVRLQGMTSGTIIVIEDLDRANFLQVRAEKVQEHLGASLRSVRQHLGMVFHRFLEDGVKIRLGKSDIPSWDPFLEGKATKLPEEQLNINGTEVNIAPFVLPHHSRLTDDEHSAAAGPNGWNDHQGFYIYRCKRLIIPGSWLNLRFRKEEHYKLARIRVDLPNSVDASWQLNVMKSHVNAPAVLKDDFRRIADAVRADASKVYRFRGEKQTPSKPSPQRFIWKRVESRGGTRYLVDRTHPMVQSLLHAGCTHDELLKQLLDVVEAFVPIASMLQEPARAIDGSVEAMDEVDVQNLREMFSHSEQFLVRAGKTPEEARRIVLSAEPFINFRSLLTELQA